MNLKKCFLLIIVTGESTLDMDMIYPYPFVFSFYG
jgi:hypothetical protein